MNLRVVALLHGVLLVELHHIVGQLVHIVRAGDKSGYALVIPESAVGRMARRQNGCTVLNSHAEHLGLEVGGLAQHVAYSGAEHVVGRHLSRLRCSAYALHRGVVAAVYHLVAVAEVVRCNAVSGRTGSSIDAGVSHTRYGRHIVEHLVVARESLVDETLHSALAELVVIVVEIVPTHLVDNDAYHQLRALHLCACHDGYAAQEYRKYQFLHNCCFSCILIVLFSSVAE